MTARTLVYHPSVAHYLKFVATTAGRDKLLRTLQYFSRFYAWYLCRTNATLGEIAPWEAVKEQFGLVRKAMRLGNSIEHFRAAAAAMAANPKNLDSIIVYCSVGRQLGYAGYLSLEALTFLDAASIRKSSYARSLQQKAYKCWMIGLLFSTVSGAYSLYTIRRECARLDKKEGEGAVAAKIIEKERATINLQLISDLCDLIIPIAALGIIGFDDGFVGLAGTASSLIGVYSQWKNTI